MPRYVKQRVIDQYKKERRFNGNRYTKKSTLPEGSLQDEQEEKYDATDVATENENNEIETMDISSSTSKIVDLSSSVLSTSSPDDRLTGFRLIDISIFANVVSCFACSECLSATLRVNENFPKIQGFASHLSVVCSNCGQSRNFYTSQKCKYCVYEVNRRMVYSMRSCRVGYAGMKKFTTAMNMPKPMTENCYERISKVTKKATKAVANKTMCDVAAEIKRDKAGIVDTCVSGDGTWQRRGYSSLNGVVAVISVDTGKVIDAEPMTRKCKGCERMQPVKKADPVSHDLWKANHTCSSNYIKRIFQRSENKHGLRYTEYYGDGDSKIHRAIENTYHGIKVQELECIGHIQKRVGNRLCKLWKDVKGLGGKGKLTFNIIDKLLINHKIQSRKFSCYEKSYPCKLFSCSFLQRK